MINVKVYQIDGVEYYLLRELEIHGVNYLYLSNVNDENDFVIRKRDKNDSMLFLPLADENEVKLASLTFAQQMLDK